jgi:chromate reductase, NAD(P)H dehydrogenase (quinone)
MEPDMQTEQQDGGRRPVRVLVFAASLRAHSLNDRLAALAADVVAAKGGVVDRATMAEFDGPSYDQDVEAADGIPEGPRRLRDRLVEADACVLAAPEYNASVPGCIKNAIDWASRHRPQPFNGRQFLLLSASPSMVGGNRGLWALRVPLEHLGARVYPDMFSLAQAHEAFGADGRLSNGVLQRRFESTIECFLDLVEAAKHYRALKKEWVEFLGEHPNAATDRIEHTPVSAA